MPCGNQKLYEQDGKSRFSSAKKAGGECCKELILHDSSRVIPLHCLSFCVVLVHLPSFSIARRTIALSCYRYYPVRRVLMSRRLVSLSRNSFKRKIVPSNVRLPFRNVNSTSAVSGLILQLEVPGALVLSLRPQQVEVRNLNNVQLRFRVERLGCSSNDYLRRQWSRRATVGDLTAIFWGCVLGCKSLYSRDTVYCGRRRFAFECDSVM